MTLELCGKAIRRRSRYSDEGMHRCFRPKGHSGACDEFPYLAHLQSSNPRVAAKIIRDATMTTGASWKSEDAGPNRIPRWVMLRTDEDLLTVGVDMKKLKPQVVAKLREKAAEYDPCMEVAAKLTHLAYGMLNSPGAPADIDDYLGRRFGTITPGTTVCLVCREQLDFRLFAAAKRGKAEIETSHANPRVHTPENVGFAHRACNIAQGNKTLEEFYDWIRDVLARARS